jgi:hypothetical protein
MDPRIRIRTKMSWIRNTARSKGLSEADLYGVLCLALGELCWLGGPEEGAQVQARQLRHVSQLLCGRSTAIKNESIDEEDSINLVHMLDPYSDGQNVCILHKKNCYNLTISNCIKTFFHRKKNNVKCTFDNVLIDFF